MKLTVPEDPTAPASTLRTRPTLLFRLRDLKDQTSWTEFYQLYHNFVFGLARRSGLSHADAQEVTQDVFKRVAETIDAFDPKRGRGTFRGWLLNLTRWRITDKFRAHQPHEKGSSNRPFPADDRTATIERIPSSEPSLTDGEIVEWQQHVLDTALARLACRVPAKQFQIFELYRRQARSVLRVARELGVNPATVYVVSHRLTKQLKIEVKRLSAQLS